MDILLFVIVLIVTAEFAVRVIRFAVTGKGGLNEPFAWWRENKSRGKHQK